MSAPCWAGLIAIANQGRVINGLGDFTGAAQALTMMYNIYHNPVLYAADFHDVTTDVYGNLLGTGYNLQTGIGTPIASQLELDLAQINHVVPKIAITPYNVEYSGYPNYATGTVDGAQSPYLVITSMHVDAGTYTDTWSLNDPTGHYVHLSGTFTDVISQGNVGRIVTPYNVVYDGNPHEATVLVIGVSNGKEVSLKVTINSTHTDAGTYEDSWTFLDPAGNYVNSSFHEKLHNN